MFRHLFRNIETVIGVCALLVAGLLASCGMHSATEINSSEVTAPPRISDVDALLERELERDAFAGVVSIRRDSRIIHEAAYGLASRELGIPHSSNGVFLTGSITKFLIAIAVLKLEEAEDLNLTQSVEEFFPGLDLEDSAGITIGHLLSHRSGLPGMSSDAMERMTNWIEAGDSYRSEDFLTYVFAQPREGVPGERRVYGNLSYDVLELVVERITGQEFSEVLTALVLGPLEMSHTGVNRRESIIEGRVPGYEATESGLENASQSDGGSVYSAASDLSRLLPALFEEGFLSEASVALLKDIALVNQVIEVSSGRSIPVIWFNGIDTGFSAEIAYYPESKTSVVLLSNIGGTLFSEIRPKLAAVLHRE